MDGPGLLPGEVEPVQHAPDPALAVADPEPPLRQRAQLRGRPLLRDRHGDHGPGSRLATPARLAGQPWPPVKTSRGRYETVAPVPFPAASAFLRIALRRDPFRAGGAAVGALVLDL